MNKKGKMHRIARFFRWLYWHMFLVDSTCQFGPEHRITRMALRKVHRYGTAKQYTYSRAVASSKLR